MFRSLLWQLCKSESSVKSHLATVFADKTESQGKVNRDWDWHVEELKDIFTACLGQVASEKTVMLFVDALDEAGTDQATDLATYFNHLSSKLLSQNSRAKICISCRHYPVLTSKVSLDIYVEQENHNDIETYVSDKLGTAVAQRFPDDPNSISKDIAKRAVGIFQWGE